MPVRLPVVVLEVEGALLEIEDRDVRGRPTRSTPRSLNAGIVFAALDVAQAITRSSGMPTMQELRQHVAEVEHLIGAGRLAPVGRDGVGIHALLHRMLDDRPGEVIDAAVAEVEPDAALPRLGDGREQLARAVEDPVAAAARTCA